MPAGTDLEKPTGNAVHLVLAGGGMCCLAYPGVLSVLAENGITFASVTGVSGGTLTGALLCAGIRPQEMERRLLEVPLYELTGEPKISYLAPEWLKDLLATMQLLRKPLAALSSPGFPKVFRALLGGDPTFSELKIPFATAGVDIVSHRFLVYSSKTHPEMKVSAAIEIAVALPLVYPPHEPPGRLVVDAGIVSECPVWIPLAFGDDLPIVAVRPTNPPMTAKPRRWLVYLAETTRSASRIRDDAMIRLMPRIRLIDIDCGDIRAYQTRISQESQRYLVRLGREAAERALESYGRDLANVHRAVMPGPRASEQDSVAEAFGLRLITDSYRTLSKEVRNQIFISYSHEDSNWRDELRKHLAPLRNTALLEWDDTKIPWGEDWREEIEQALAATRIAVLLVTPTYLSSDFINTTELPLIFAARKRGDLQVVPIAIRHSVVEGTALAELQFANDLAAPLSTFKDNERDRMLSELCLKITKRMQAA